MYCITLFVLFVLFVCYFVIAGGGGEGYGRWNGYLYSNNFDTHAMFFYIAEDPIPSTEDSGKVQFSVLLRKGAKQTFKNFSVPTDSDIAINLQRQEEEDRAEKERVKALTLKFNERQEEEDTLATIASVRIHTPIIVY